MFILFFRYYAVCFLNQILLNNDEDELALRLINIYFSFFKVLYLYGNFYDLVTLIRPLFFEYLFYKPIDHSWNPPREIKLNFYYYFCTDPPEHRKWIRLLYGLIQDGDMSFLLSKLFQLFLQ